MDVTKIMLSSLKSDFSIISIKFLEKVDVVVKYIKQNHPATKLFFYFK